MVARARALGRIRHAHAHVSWPVPGWAGAAGGTKNKPVGTVWFGFQVDGVLSSETYLFAGDRAAIRAATVRHALNRLLQLLDNPPGR